MESVNYGSRGRDGGLKNLVGTSARGDLNGGVGPGPGGLHGSFAGAGQMARGIGDAGRSPAAGRMAGSFGRPQSAQPDRRYREEAPPPRRQASAVPNRGRAASDIRKGNSGPAFTKPKVNKLSANERMSARARVEEKRHIKESVFWGREAKPQQQDRPAFWSERVFGEPFNDPRLAQGSAAHYKVVDPKPLNIKEPPPAGPASEVSAFLRKSLRTGARLYDPATLQPDHNQLGLPKGMEYRLRNEDREYILAKLPPQQRIHALREGLNEDKDADDYMPWVWYVDDSRNGPWRGDQYYVKELWRRDKDMAIRLAVQCMERKMRRHLAFISERERAKAQAPAALMKDILKRNFWRVDPNKTGDVSLQQFMQVWQNCLRLCEYEDNPARMERRSLHDPNKTVRKLVPLPHKPVIVDRNVAAALFVKYGFDAQGFLPYAVFMNALTSKPARLLGHELVLDKKELGQNGLATDVDVALACGDAKVIYKTCASGVFPPSGFDPRVAHRSKMAPQAHMYLEHVYGYAGTDNLANNVFYTYNTTAPNPEEADPRHAEGRIECVYYVGMVGVVYDKVNNKQKFFFGHDNDILCLAIHPNRRFVATGQQKNVKRDKKKEGEKENDVPYVCVWDVDACECWQRLDHAEDERAVIAVAFSGDVTKYREPGARGGDIVVTVTADDGHTIHIWRWWNREKKYMQGQYIPGWFFGPEKKLTKLREEGMYYNPRDFDDERTKEQLAVADNEPDTSGDEGDNPDNPKVRTAPFPDAKDTELWRRELAGNITPVDAAGFHVTHQPGPMYGSDTAVKLATLKGIKGKPPAVYGIVWNPFRPHDARRGAEFLSYGVKHLKTWIMDDSEQPRWIGKPASFGAANIESVYSALYVRARHARAAPGDSCILTGFSAGTIGLWIPPYPTRAGAQYTLMRTFKAHEPGPLIAMNDGSQLPGGVRVLRVRDVGKDSREVLSGGSDGCVRSWILEPPSDTPRPDGTPRKGVRLTKGSTDIKLTSVNAPFEGEVLPMVRGLDCIATRRTEFIAGTDGCDIWEVDADPRTLVDGHTHHIYMVAPHPICTDELKDYFVTASEGGSVHVWNMRERVLVRTAAVGFKCRSVAVSEDELHSDRGMGYHIAVGGLHGRIMILDWQTLQPLVDRKDTNQCIGDMKFSPRKGPKLLAAASNDMKIYIYKCEDRKDGGLALYTRLSVCVGHSGTITQIDWSLPLQEPMRLKGECVLQSNDASCEILHWNPRTGKKIAANQRDTAWHTWSCIFGFDVMGIWPDGSDRTDINACSRSRRGKPKMNRDGATFRRALGSNNISADEIPGAGYVVIADDYSFVRLYNYPAVWDDAPFRCYRGHASHVMCVRFAADDRRVLSVGGADRSVFQWKTIGINRHDADDDDHVLEQLSPERVIALLRAKKDSLVPKTSLSAAQWGELVAGSGVYGPLDDVKRVEELKQSGTFEPLKSGKGGGGGGASFGGQLGPDWQP